MLLVFAIILLVLGGLLLLAYPAVLMASVMLLAGLGATPGDWGLKKNLTMIFAYATLAYPVVYLPALIVAIVMMAKSWMGWAVLWSSLPFVYILLLVAIFVFSESLK